MEFATRLIHRAPILICGAPRTGTSWTAKTLSLCGNVRYMREPLSHGGYAADAGRAGVPYLRAGDDEPEYEALWRRPVLSISPLVRRRWLMAESRPFVRRVPFWPARLLIKEIACPLALDWLSERFGMAVVVTARHPCGYVASGLRLRDVGHPVLDLDQLLGQPRLVAEHFPRDRAWLARLEDPVARMAAAYGMVYQVIGEQMADHPEWNFVHHEALCRDPRGSFRRLSEAVGVGYGRSAEEFLAQSTGVAEDGLYSLRRVSAEVPDRWRTDLTAGQIATVAGVLSRFRLPARWEFD